MYTINNKDKVLESAFRLSLKYGFDNVSIKQIQDGANVSAGTIYYYFNDKDDILVNMLNKYLKDEVKKFDKNIRNYEGSFPEKLKFIFYHNAGVELNNKTHGIRLSDSNVINHEEFNLFMMSTYHKHLEVRPVFHEINKMTLRTYTDIVDEFKQKNEIRDDIDSEDIALYIFTVISGFLQLWISSPHISIEKLVDTNVKMICESIVK